jgi:hypothetical protein
VTCGSNRNACFVVLELRSGRGVAVNRRTLLRFGLALTLVGAPFSLLASALLGACKQPPGPLDFHGVRLGMTPADVRARFEPGANGAFLSQPGASVVLTWTPTGRAPVVEAEFQFHNGMLTYLHAEVFNSNPLAEGPDLWVGPTSVVERKRGVHTTKVLSIARDCPTHADKVRELEAQARR